MASRHSLQYFTHKIKDWEEKGYVDLSIWKCLQKDVTGDVFPTFSERRSARKRPYSPSADDGASSAGVTSDVQGSAIQGKWNTVNDKFRFKKTSFSIKLLKKRIHE